MLPLRKCAHCHHCAQRGSASVTVPTNGRGPAAFTYFAIWPAGQFESEGGTVDHGGRRFCPECGCPPWTSKAELRQGVPDE
ncbi:hypothetical protein EHI48_20375 [Rhizobium sp. WSM1325]|nr:hypothetical protein EHI48_20375 [Rhizobium leguminosarum]